MDDILERLRGYNPPDRSSDNIRAAMDIDEAANEIARLRAENERIERQLAALRAAISEPSPDIQEAVIKKLDLVSRDAVDKARAETWEKAAKIVTEYGRADHPNAVTVCDLAATALRAAAEKEKRDG